MPFHDAKQNIIIFLCIFLMISACQKENKNSNWKNNQVINTKTKNNGKLNTENLQTYKIIKKEVTSNNENPSINLKNDNVVFEFRNERLLQGRNP